MSKAVKAGIFITVTVFAVIVLNLWMSHFRMREEGYPVIAHFPSVIGLKKRDAVRVYGVEKGLVQDIQFKGKYVEVTIWLSKDVKLYRDAYATIKDVAMISGTKFVDLDPGSSGEPFEESDTVKGEASLGIPYSVIGDIAVSIDRLLSSENLNNIKSALLNIESATKDFERLVSQAEKHIEPAVSEVTATARSIKSLSLSLKKTLSQLDAILGAIEKEEGTIGRLVRDDSLYIEIEKTVKATKALVEDIKNNPKKYLSIF